MFEFFVARRYLRAKRKQVVISVITVISIIGVAAGVMALVIALAINNGFRETLQRNLLAATAPVSILEKEPAGGIENWQETAQKLTRLPHVTSASPGFYDNGLLSGPIDNDGAEIKGIPVDGKAPLPVTLEHLKSGTVADLHSQPGQAPGIILGAKLAEKLASPVGKFIRLLIPNGWLTPVGPQPATVRLRVAGVFESGYSDMDAHWAYMSLEDAQRVFGFGDVVNSIELMLDDIYEAPAVADAANKIVGPKLAATTWQEQNKAILGALRMERMATAVTIFLIQIVAALNILIALIMMVMEKHRDIAILMSMGARGAQIRRIFVLEGAMIGVVGTSIGLILGYTLSYFADRYRWLPLNDQVYMVSYVPFNSHWLDGIWIAAAAMAISLLATLYPARNATRIAPVEALRYE